MAALHRPIASETTKRNSNIRSMHRTALVIIVAIVIVGTKLFRTSVRPSGISMRQLGGVATLCRSGGGSVAEHLLSDRCSLLVSENKRLRIRHVHDCRALEAT